MNARRTTASLVLLALFLAVPPLDAQNRQLRTESLRLDDNSSADGTLNTFTIQVPVAGLTADRTFTFPDADGSPPMAAAPLVANQSLFGGATGGVAQNANFLFDNTANSLLLTQVLANDAMVITHSGTDGHGLHIDQTNAANTENVLRIDAAGDGDAVNINVSGDGDGLDIDMSASASNDGISIEQDGSGFGIGVEASGGAEAGFFLEDGTERSVTVVDLGDGEGLIVFEEDAGDGMGVDESGPGWGMGIFEADGGDGLHITEEDAGDALHIESFDDGRALIVDQQGTADAALRVQNTGAATAALVSLANSGTGRGVDVNQSGTAGAAGRFRITNAANGANALAVTTSGTGRVLDVNHSGTGGQAVRLRATNAANSSDVLRVTGNAGSNAIRVTAGDVDVDTDLNVDGVGTIGTLHINGAAATTNARLVVDDGHWTSQQTTAPAAAVAGANVTSAALSNETDVAGMIDITTSGAPASGAQATVTFNTAYATAPIVVLTPANGGATVAEAFVTRTTAGFTINFNAAAPAASTSHQFFYQVIETQ